MLEDLEYISDTPCEHIERRTKIDIIFGKVVEHVDAEVKICIASLSSARTMGIPLKRAITKKPSDTR